MNNQLQTFQNNALTANIRCSINESDGSVWFVAGDMAKALEYTRTDAMLSHCEDSAVLPQLNKINSLAPATKWINESDLYSAIFGSTKPEAKAFKKWVTSEILPSIRKTGKYEAPTQTEQPKLAPLKDAVYFMKEAAKMFKLSETSKMRGMMAISEAYNLPNTSLPAYSPNEDLTKSICELLKEHNVNLSAKAANKILERLGYLKTLERRSTGNTIKTFWSITEKGLPYGRNETPPQSPNQTQPRWYVSTFGELVEEMTIVGDV